VRTPYAHYIYVPEKHLDSDFKPPKTSIFPIVLYRGRDFTSNTTPLLPSLHTTRETTSFTEYYLLYSTTFFIVSPLRHYLLYRTSFFTYYPPGHYLLEHSFRAPLEPQTLLESRYLRTFDPPSQSNLLRITPSTNYLTFDAPPPSYERTFHELPPPPRMTLPLNHIYILGRA
jgi:hypothetical protein